MIEQIQEWQLGWQRYEKARRLNPSQWAGLHRRNLNGEWFDDMIDALDHVNGGIEMVVAPVVPTHGVQVTPEQLTQMYEDATAIFYGEACSCAMDAVEWYAASLRVLLDTPAQPPQQSAQPVEVQRVGLAKDQIIDATCRLDVTAPGWVITFTRAIEAAHGIKPASEGGAA